MSDGLEGNEIYDKYQSDEAIDDKQEVLLDIRISAA
jgi:hypothetical protein